jgi:hypothetical protein
MHEPDDGMVHFERRRPFDHDAISRSADLTPAREDDGVGTEDADTSASLRLDRETMSEAAE